MDWRVRIPEAWSASHRRVLVGLLAALLLMMSVRYARNRMYVSDPQPVAAPRYAELADRLDPNIADANLLASLPSIGPARAREIVRFRERFMQENPGQVPFRRPEDLMRVRGIGPAIVNTIRPYLIFPPPESRQAERGRPMDRGDGECVGTDMVAGGPAGDRTHLWSASVVQMNRRQRLLGDAVALAADTVGAGVRA